MFLQVLQSMALPDEALKYVKLIYCQTNLLINLVADFQDMNLDTAGMLQAKICDFDPRQVFQTVATMFEIQAALEGSIITFKNLTPKAFDIVRETDSLKQLPNSVMSQIAVLPAKLSGD